MSVNELNTGKDVVKPKTPIVRKRSTTRTAPKTVEAAPEPAKPTEMPLQHQIAPFSVKKKKNENKVVRDSFSFPEQDYHKISELKKICLSAGVHVKKGELLRAGLNLLTEMTLAELLQAVEKIERVKTGRPKQDKK